ASPRKKKFPYYRMSLITLLVVSLSIVLFAKQQLLTLVDIATTLSFLIAPVVAIANFRLVTNKDFPQAARPKAWLRILSILGIVFLSAFCLVFIYIKLK
ncbi:MAG: hypothetical protein P8H98_03760, partial [Flavobacteriales bacterium]|nr:hypothetical protein [Flavobacteriales bacterium]